MPEDTKPPVEGEEPVVKPDPMAEMKELISSLQGSIGNLKSEFNRKIDSIKPQAPVLPKKNIQELMYENPEQAVEEIERSVEARITSRLETREGNKAIAQKIYTDYPELKDPGNPLAQKANEIFETFTDAEKKDPRTLRTAVYEAAAEIGLAPSSKRKKVVEQNDDNFSLGGSKGGSKGQGRKKDADLDPNTLEVAALMGIDTSDPKAVERLKKHSTRTFGKYGS